MGQFHSLEERPSTRRTVHTAIEALLLRAAKEADEAAHAGAANELARGSEEVRSPESTAGGTFSPVELPRRGVRGPHRERSIADAVVSGTGEVLRSRGDGPPDFPARVAYAARLAHLVGSAIGSGRPRAIRVEGATTHMLVCPLPDDSIVASLSRADRGAAPGGEAAGL